MKLHWLLGPVLMACAWPAWGATDFVYPVSSCTITDNGHTGPYPLWYFNYQNGPPDDGYGTVMATFGYSNLAFETVNIAQGNENQFIQNPELRNQPTSFASGQYPYVFATTLEPGIGLTWFLNGTYATVAANEPLCPVAGANGFLPGQFPPIGLANGQTIRINSACGGTLSFVDQAGNAVGQSLTAASGSIYLDLVGTSALVPGGGRKLVQPISTGCQSGVEVYASSTGVTAAFMPALQPAYQYSFAPLGLSADQTIRFNISASASEGCGAFLKFTDGNGNTLGNTLSQRLAPGEAANLDLPSTLAPGLSGWYGGHVEIWPVLQTMATQTTVDGGTQIGLFANGLLESETCFASVEIFDTLTGLTRVIELPQRVQ